jgi:TP901 family phage tail tape measure protein
MPLNIKGKVVGLEESINDIQNRVNRRGGIKLNINERSFTQPLGRITHSADEFTKSLEASNARVLAFGASAAIIGGVTRAFSELVLQAVKVEKILTDINVVLNTSLSNLSKFGNDLFDVARNTSQSLEVAAEAALEFSRQGLSMEETLRRTNDALILTRLTGIQAADAVSGLTAAVNGFADAGLTTTQIINKLAAVDVKFAVSADDLIDALARAGAVAQDAGVNFDQLVGAVTSAQQITARGGAVIGNSFKTIFTRIQRSSTLDRLEELGVAVRDIRGNTLPAISVLTNLSKAYDTLGSATKAAVAEQVGGVFQINILKAALKDLNRENSLYAQATDISANATNQAQLKNEQLQQTLSSLAKQTSLTIQELSANIGDLALAPGISKILDAINSFGTALNDLFGKDSEGLGSDFAKGIVRGIGSVLTGPGLVLAFGVFAKLFANALKFAKSSLKDILGIVSAKDKERLIQESIVSAMSQNKNLAMELNRYAGDKVKQEQLMLGLIKEQTSFLLQQQKIAASIAPGLVRRGVKPDLTMPKTGGGSTASSGLIPDFEETQRERRGAFKAGYSPGTVKAMEIEGIGKVVYNDAETVREFPGMKQPGIMPPKSSKAGKKYKEKFKEQHGFDPYAFGGFVPNFIDNRTRQQKIKDTLKDPANKNIKFNMPKKKVIKSKNIWDQEILRMYQENPNQQYLGKPLIEYLSQKGYDRKQLQSLAKRPSEFTIMSQGLIPNFALQAQQVGSTLKLPKAKMFAQTSDRKLAASGWQNITSPIRSLMKEAPSYRAVFSKLEELGVKNISRAIYFANQDASMKAGRSAYAAAKKQKSPGMRSRTGGAAYEKGLGKTLKSKGYKSTDKHPTANVDFIAPGKMPIEAKYGSAQKDSLMAKSLKIFGDKSLENFLKKQGASGLADSLSSQKLNSSLSTASKIWNKTATQKDVELLRLHSGFIPNFMSGAAVQNSNFTREPVLSVPVFKDGDSVDAIVAKKPSNVDHRLSRVDAIEKDQALGAQATTLAQNSYKGESGKKLLEKNRIVGGKAAYGRGLFKDDTLAKKLVSSGLGVPDFRYVSKSAFSSDVQSAIKGKRGIWQDKYENHPKRQMYEYQSGMLSGQGTITTKDKDPSKTTHFLGGSKFTKSELEEIEDIGIDAWEKKQGRGGQTKAKNFRQSLLFKGANRKQKDSALGFIPNFANPLEEAIDREKSAGVRESMIRIDQDDRLRSRANPMGLAVTNTRDEPAGVSQGIKRAREMGIDPKTHGASNGLIPNFQDVTRPGGIDEGYLARINKSTKDVIDSNQKASKATTDYTGRLFALTSATYLLEGMFSDMEGTAGEATKTIVGVTKGISQGALAFEALGPVSTGLSDKLSKWGAGLQATGGSFGKTKGMMGTFIKGLGGAAKNLPLIGSVVAGAIPIFSALKENTTWFDSSLDTLNKSAQKTAKSIEAVGSAMEATTSVQQTQKQITDLTNSSQANTYQGQMKLLSLNSTLIKNQDALQQSALSLAKELNLSGSELQMMTSGTAQGMEKLQEAMAKLTIRQSVASSIKNMNPEDSIYGTEDFGTYDDISSRTGLFSSWTSPFTDRRKSHEEFYSDMDRKDRINFKSGALGIAQTMNIAGVKKKDALSQMGKFQRMDTGDRFKDLDLMEAYAEKIQEANQPLAEFVLHSLAMGKTAEHIRYSIGLLNPIYQDIANEGEKIKKENEIEASISKEINVYKRSILNAISLQATQNNNNLKLLQDEQNYAIQRMAHQSRLTESLGFLSEETERNEKIAIEQTKIENDYLNKKQKANNDAIAAQNKIAADIFAGSKDKTGMNFSALQGDYEKQVLKPLGPGSLSLSNPTTVTETVKASENPEEALQGNLKNLQKQLTDAGMSQLAAKLEGVRAVEEANARTLDYVKNLTDASEQSAQLTKLQNMGVISMENLDSTLAAINQSKDEQLRVAEQERSMSKNNIDQLRKELELNKGGLAAARQKVLRFQEIENVHREVKAGMKEEVETQLENGKISTKVNEIKRKILASGILTANKIKAQEVLLDKELTNELEVLDTQRARMAALEENTQLQKLHNQVIREKIQNERDSFGQKISDSDISTDEKFKKSEKTGRTFFQEKTSFDINELKNKGREAGGESRSKFEKDPRTGKTFFQAQAEFDVGQLKIKGDELAAQFIANKEAGLYLRQTFEDMAEEGRQFSINLQDLQTRLKQNDFGKKALQGVQVDALNAQGEAQGVEGKKRIITDPESPFKGMTGYEVEAGTAITKLNTGATELAEQYAANKKAGFYAVEAQTNYSNTVVEGKIAQEQFTEALKRGQFQLEALEEMREAARAFAKEMIKRKEKLAAGESYKEGGRDVERNQISAQESAQRAQGTRDTYAAQGNTIKTAEADLEVARSQKELNIELGNESLLRDTITERIKENNLALARFDETLANTTFDAVENGFKQLVKDMGDSTMSAGDAFKKFAGGIAQSISDALTEKAAKQITSGLFEIGQSFMSDEKYKGGLIRGYASGGTVGGNNKVPAMLTNGEYVVRKKIVDKLGINSLDSINKSGSLSELFDKQEEESFDLMTENAAPMPQMITMNNGGVLDKHLIQKNSGGSVSEGGGSEKVASSIDTLGSLIERFYGGLVHLNQGGCSGGQCGIGGSSNESKYFKDPQMIASSPTKPSKSEQRMASLNKVASGIGTKVGQSLANYENRGPQEYTGPTAPEKMKQLNTYSALNLDPTSNQMSSRFRANDQYTKDYGKYLLDKYQYDVEQRNAKTKSNAATLSGLTSSLTLNLASSQIMPSLTKLGTGLGNKYKNWQQERQDKKTDAAKALARQTPGYLNEPKYTGSTTTQPTPISSGLSSTRQRRTAIGGGNFTMPKDSRIEEIKRLSSQSRSSSSQFLRTSSSEHKHHSMLNMMDQRASSMRPYGPGEAAKYEPGYQHGGIINHLNRGGSVSSTFNNPYSYFNRGGSVSNTFNNPYSYFNRGGSVSNVANNPYSYFNRGGSVSSTFNNPYSYFNRGGSVSNVANNPYSYFNRGGSVSSTFNNPYSYFNRGGSVSSTFNNPYSYFNRGGYVSSTVNNPYSYFNRGGSVSSTFNNPYSYFNRGGSVSNVANNPYSYFNRGGSVSSTFNNPYSYFNRGGSVSSTFNNPYSYFNRGGSVSSTFNNPYSYFNRGGSVSSTFNNPYSYFNRGGYVSSTVNNPYSYFNRGGSVSNTFNNPYSYFNRGGSVSSTVNNPYSYFNRGGSVSSTFNNPYSYFNRGGSVSNVANNPYSYFNRGGSVSNVANNPYSYFNKGGSVTHTVTSPYSYFNRGGTVSSYANLNQGGSVSNYMLNNRSVKYMSDGGKVHGPGGIDKVGPIMLDKGEYVIKASSVNSVEKKYPGFFNKLNSMKMNQGGMVGGASPTPATTTSETKNESNSSSNVTVNINISSSGEASSEGGGPSEQELAAKIKDAVVGVMQQEKRVGGMLSGK